jgi:hypothetical protein
MPEADALHPLTQQKRCHPRESGGPRAPLPGWIPAFAGMTGAPAPHTHTIRFGDTLGIFEQVKGRPEVEK